MFRRIIIPSQVLLSGSLAAAGMVALWHDVGWRGRLSERHWGEVAIQGGVLHVAYARRVDASFMPHGWRVPLWNLGDLTIRSGTTPTGWRYGLVHVPVWMVVMLLTVHPALALIRGPLLHRYRRKRHLCLSCGYDRSYNRAGPCSECGSAGET